MSGQFQENRDINNVKKNLKLNLNSKNLSLPLNPPILSSPDLKMLKVGTPELENMILNTNMTNTPTPSIGFPKAVTVEQESFTAGFIEALHNLHNNSSMHGTNIFHINKSLYFLINVDYHQLILCHFQVRTVTQAA